MLAVTAGALFFTAGTFLAPALAGSGDGRGGLLRAFYAPMCHQSAERCMQVAGFPQAVCARCSGLYLGGVAGLLLGALLVAGRGMRPRGLWLALALAPTVVDALLPWVGLPQLPNLPRLLLAFPAGAMAGLFLAVGLTDLTIRDRSRASDPGARNNPAVLEETDG